MIERIPPHITLIPPINVHVDDIGSMLQTLRQAAADLESLDLTIGPPASFLPRNPVVFLGVSDAGGVAKLRQSLQLPPLDRPDSRPFVPHVTIATGTTVERINATTMALRDFEVAVRIERLHLLEMYKDDKLGTRWVPIADYAFEPRRIVGRGGLELEITRSFLMDPDAMAFEDREWPDDLERPESRLGRPSSPTSCCQPVVVTGRRIDEGVVGVARGWVSGASFELQSVLVARAVRGQGIGGHLLAAFDHFRGEVAADMGESN